jgi:hypothetical protein
MSAAAGSAASSRLVLPARVFLAVIGVVAVLWGVVTFPLFWRLSPLVHAMNRIVYGDPYKLESLTSLIPAMEAVEKSSFCYSTASRSVAIIRLRIAEETLARGDQAQIDPQLELLNKSIRNSLSCAPADPFLWLVLYWVESTRNGFRAEYLNYLRMSYEVGPNEGWIALRRNHLALAIFQHLPADLQEHALDEFAAMVRSEFYSEAATILAGPGWQERNLLLARLKNVPERTRRNFSDILVSRNLDVEVPGVTRKDLPQRK